MQVYIALTASARLVSAAGVGHRSGVVWFETHLSKWRVCARCPFIAFSASIAHWLVYVGTVQRGAATIAPMTCAQLLSAMILGCLFFLEVPDRIALAGAAVIIGSGLALWFFGWQGPRLRV